MYPAQLAALGTHLGGYSPWTGLKHGGGAATPGTSLERHKVADVKQLTAVNCCLRWSGLSQCVAVQSHMLPSVLSTLPAAI